MLMTDSLIRFSGNLTLKAVVVKNNEFDCGSGGSGSNVKLSKVQSILHSGFPHNRTSHFNAENNWII